MSETLFTRGTADEGYGVTRRKKSPLEEFIDELNASTMRGYGPAIEAGGKLLSGFLGAVSISPQTELAVASTAAKATAAGLPEETVKDIAAGKRELQQQAQLEANKGLGLGPVGVALGGAEQAWSYGVARPASTAALLGDPTSPLYKQGTVNLTNQFGETEIVPVKEGFQVEDIGLAWNRSEQVSAGQAAAANTFAQAIPGFNVLTTIGGVNNYNPWSNYSLDQAQDNSFYNFVTGSTDASLQILVPPAFKVGRLAAMERAGLKTTINSAKEIDVMRSDWDAHRSWTDTNGDIGTKTTIGMGIDELTLETNPNKIRQHPFVANADGMDKQTFSNILAQTTDRDTVAALVLASRGDYRSMLDLMDRAPDYVWTLADSDRLVLNNWITTGKTLNPEGEAFNRINQIFDSNIARDEYFSEVKRAFTTEEGLLKVGSTWMPTKSIVVEKIRGAAGKTRYAIKQADYSGSPKFIQTIASSKFGGPTTIFLQYVGSRKPLGRVTRSGARPDDIWDELNAQFDSVPGLRGAREVVVGERVVDGQVIPIKITANEYRQQLGQRLYEASNNNNLEVAWRQMEDELVIVFADSLNVPREQAIQFMAGYRARANEQLGYMQAHNGYLYDELGSRIILDPQTRRQFLDSFMAMPMDEIYHGLRDIVSPAARTYNQLTGFGTDAFDAGMKFFRTNVLFRPGYTGKNSVLEPLLSSWLAHGTILTDEGLSTTLSNFWANRKANTKAAVYALELDTFISKFIRRQPKKTRKALSAELKALVNQRHAILRTRDLALADLERVKKGGVRPSLAPEVESAARETLVKATIDLQKIEGMIDGITPEWRQVVEPASLVTIKSKLFEYDNLIASGQAPEELSKLVEDLRANYEKVINETADAIDVPYKELDNLDKQLEILDSKIGAAQRELGEAREKFAAVTGQQGFVGSGSGYMKLTIGDEEFQVPAAFADVEFNFGSGYRAEASEALTSRLTYDPSYQANYMTGRMIRNGQPTETLPTADNYWDELAHVANFQLRDDLLVQRILRGDSRADIAKWLSTPEGRSYQKSMNRNYLITKERYQTPVTSEPEIDTLYSPRKLISESQSDIPRQEIPGKKTLPSERKPLETQKRSKLDRILKPSGRTGRRVILESTTELDEVIRIVNQYFPDPKVRQLIASREVTAGELQKAMGAREDLSRILGEDLTYLPRGPVSNFWDKTNKVLDNIWQLISTTPTDRIARWPFYQREFRHQMELRANILAGQGVKMSEPQLRALRQSAHRAALAELEKTFYNIRRYNTPIYTSRFLLSFPGAFFNSIYRYGRFAVKEPERMFQTALFANDLLLNMGVDAEGNPVKDIGDAEYILIPGTKRNAADTGLRIPVSSFATLTVNYPSLSWGANMLVNTVVKNKPSTEEIIRKALGETVFEEMFPYGFQRNPVSGLFGSYQKDFWRAFQGPSDTDYIQTTVQIYADKMAQWEMNGMPEGEQPSFADAANDATAFFVTRGATKFFSPLAVDRKVPGQLMRDAWYDIREQFPEDTAAAREAFTKKYGDAARWYTFSSSEYVTYIPSSQDAYERVWVDYPHLAREMKSIVGNDNSEYISLLTLGSDGTFSQSVSNYMRDNPLPGDDVPVITRMQPEQFDNVVNVYDGWAIYSRNRSRYDAELNRLRTLRDNADTDYDKERYRAAIKANEDSWNRWVNVDGPLATNEAWQFDRNDSEQRAPRAAILLNKIIKDPKFAKNDGKTALWQNVSVFLDSRQKALDAVKAKDKPEEKAAVKKSFAKWVEDEILTETPEFYPTWERYFIGEWVKENG